MFYMNKHQNLEKKQLQDFLALFDYQELRFC